MDTVNNTRQVTDFFKKYRYVALVLLVGVFLMLLPEGNEEPEAPQTVMQEETVSCSVQDSLEELLSCVQGAGKVRLLLTYSAGESIVYQTDEDSGNGSLRTETVVLSDSGNGEYGLVQQVNPPEYLGAVILCQGADSASVRLALVEAVANATGLTADKISVLKMK